MTPTPSTGSEARERPDAGLVHRLRRLADIYSARAFGTAKVHPMGRDAPTAVTDRQNAIDLHCAIALLSALPADSLGQEETGK